MFNPEKLRIYRKAKGWTQQDLAEKAGCDRNSISRIEIRKLKPSRALIERMAEALEVDVESLYVAPEDLPPEPPPPPVIDGHELTGLQRRLLSVVRRLPTEVQGELLGLAIARAAGVPLDRAGSYAKLGLELEGQAAATSREDESPVEAQGE